MCSDEWLQITPGSLTVLICLAKETSTVQWQLPDASGTLHATQQSPPRAKVPKAADKVKMQSAAHPTESGEVEQALYLLKGKQPFW